MPKLNDNVKHNLYNGRVIDKESDDIMFFDDTHEYISKKDGVKGVSVTTLIHHYTNPFDEDFWSSYKALEALLPEDLFYVVKPSLLASKKFSKEYITKFKIDPKKFEKKKQEILDGYEKNRVESCERGTKIHANIESSFYAGNKKEIKKYGVGGSLPIYEGRYPTKVEAGVYPEYLVSYRKDDFLLTGQVDICWIDHDGNLYIGDHKTNRKIEMKSYYDKKTKSSVKMKFPLNNIDDVNGRVYELQLSTYAWMLQQNNPELKVKRLFIHWIDHDGKESFIDVDYRKSDVERMIKHYMKHLKIQKELDRDKPFII